MAAKQEKATWDEDPKVEPEAAKDADEEAPAEDAAPEVATRSIKLAEDADADEVAVAVPGLSAEDAYTDEHGRVVVSTSPVDVPPAVADLIVSSAPYVVEAS